MAKEILVDIDLNIGEKVVEAIDEARFPASVIAWIKDEKFEEWRLCISSPLFDKLGHGETYLQLREALKAVDPELRFQANLSLKSNRDPLIRGLRSLFAKTASVHGMRLGGQAIGGVWLDDAYVYRIK